MTQEDSEEIRLKKAIIDRVLKSIATVEEEIKKYEGLVDKTSVLIPPYERAIKTYEQGVQTFIKIGLITEATKLKDGIETYRQKILADRQHRELYKQQITKTKEEAQLLEERVRISQEQLRQREQEEKDRRKRETHDRDVKQTIADQILKEITLIEQEVKTYESKIDRIPYQAPYEKAIIVYEKLIKSFNEIQWTEQATKLLDGIKAYQQKLSEDHRYRETERLRVAKTKEEERMLEERARISLEQTKQREREDHERRQREIQDRQVKQSIADKILKDIDVIEQEIKTYESRVDRIPYLPPFERAIALYEKSAKALAEIGWTTEATKLLDGLEAYRQKSAADSRYREIEKQRIAKSKEEEKLLEERARISLEQMKQREREELERRQRELQDRQVKQSIADKILKDIDVIEQEIKIYEARVDRIPYLAPYEKAITIYEKCAKALAEIGWTVEATKLLEGLSAYRQKLVADAHYREIEKQRIAHSKEEEQILEERARISLEQAKQRTNEEKERRQREIQEYQFKQTMADRIFKEISQIESEVKAYETLPDKIPFEPVYQRAIGVYEKSAKALAEIGWTTEATKLLEGLEAYRQKSAADSRYRELEKARIGKTHEEERMLEERAKLAKEMAKQQEMQKKERLQREHEENQLKKSISDRVFNEITQIESEVKKYESLPDKMVTSAPFERAIGIYEKGAKTLADIGFATEVNKLMEGINTYRQKLANDLRYRELEKARIVKTHEEERLLQERVRLTEEIQRKRIIEERQQRENEAREQQKKQAVNAQILNEISQIENEVKRYEESPNRFLMESPYEKAVQIYHNGANRSKEIQLFEDSLKFLEGMQNYQDKVMKDKVARNLEKERKMKSEKEAQALEATIRSEQELKAKKQKEEALRRIEQQKEEEFKQQKGKEAFQLLDEGNNQAKLKEFDLAIQKYQDAIQLFNMIGWENEADKALTQISLFRQQHNQWLVQIQYQKEDQQRILREQAELDQQIQYSSKIEAQKAKEEEEKRQKLAEMRRLEEEKAFQQRILEDEYQQRMKEEARQQHLQGEREKAQKNQQIYSMCLILLEQAKNQAIAAHYEDALSIYHQVLQKYQQIDYVPGIQLTYDSIQKVKRDAEAYQEQKRLQSETAQQQLEEQKRLEALIRITHEEKERIHLQEQKSRLEEQIRKQQEQNVQNQIISLLEQGGLAVNKNAYDEGLQLYQKAFALFEGIQWPLKHQQVLELIEETKQKKVMYLTQQEALQSLKEKQEQERTLFEELMAKQDAERQILAEKTKKETQIQRQQAAKEKMKADEAYFLLGEAEASLKKRHYYYALHFLHHAYRNFTENQWARESETVKTRYYQVAQIIEHPYLEPAELFANSNLIGEYQAISSLERARQAEDLENYSEALLHAQSTIESFIELEWKQGSKQLEQYYQDLIRKQAEYNHRLSLPTEENAKELFTQAAALLNKNLLLEARQLGNKAREIYTQLKRDNDVKRLDQELLRWKMLEEKYQKNTPEQKAKEFLREEINQDDETQRRKRIIEERKERRREARRKISDE